jgi:predicted Zn finger-like uncharacterized protein
MRTQCPHCKAKFSTPQESEGKKIKCPKCSELFVIEKLIETSCVEVCTHCGNVIGRLEQACVFEGDIVCTKCDNKLRNIESIQSPQTEPLQATLEKTKNTNKSNVSIAGIILSFILFFLAFLNTQDRPANTVNPDVDSLLKTIPFIWCATGLIMFIRSFLPGLGFLKVVLTVVGSFLVFGTGALFVVLLSKHGLPSNLCGVIGGLLPGFIGGIMVAYGFKPKKGLRKKR